MKKAGITIALTVAVNDRKANIVAMNLFIMLCFGGVIGTTSSLRASQSEEILSPESGYVDLRYRSDDKVVALTYQSDFSPDKFQYEKGETVKVRFEIKVDPTSRGYKPNRQYYIMSPYVKECRLSADFEMTWIITKSNIDTLEVVTDDQSLIGELELQLTNYRDKQKAINSDNGKKMYFSPEDTSRVVRYTQSGPPLIKFTAYRISSISDCDSNCVRSYGAFKYDQRIDVAFTGKVAVEIWEKQQQNINKKTTPKSGSYLPSKQWFREIRGGRLTTDTIKVLANTSLERNILVVDWLDTISHLSQ